jgi:hypothetical protein
MKERPDSEIGYHGDHSNATTIPTILQKEKQGIKNSTAWDSQQQFAVVGGLSIRLEDRRLFNLVVR